MDKRNMAPGRARISPSRRRVPALGLCRSASALPGLTRNLREAPSPQTGTARWTHPPVTHSKQTTVIQAARNFIPTPSTLGSLGSQPSSASLRASAVDSLLPRIPCNTLRQPHELPFLIDTAAIRIRLNSPQINNLNFSNRHKLRPSESYFLPETSESSSRTGRAEFQLRRKSPRASAIQCAALPAASIQALHESPITSHESRGSY